MRSKSPELMNEIKKYIEDYYLQNRQSHRLQRLLKLLVLLEVQHTNTW